MCVEGSQATVQLRGVFKRLLFAKKGHPKRLRLPATACDGGHPQWEKDVCDGELLYTYPRGSQPTNVQAVAAAQCHLWIFAPEFLLWFFPDSLYSTNDCLILPHALTCMVVSIINGSSMRFACFGNEVIHESRIYELYFVLKTTPLLGTYFSDMVLPRLMAI